METKRPQRTVAKVARRTPRGLICRFPFCGQIEVKYRVRAIRLVSLDLYDPKRPNKVWMTIRPPFTAQATRAANQALRNAARGGRADLPCLDPGCECTLLGRWGAWSPWRRVPIAGGFSIPAPNPPPAQLRYRANGTAPMQARYQPGICYGVAIEP